MNITKGEWEVDKSGEFVIANDTAIADIYPEFTDIIHNHEERKANAQLIALAGNLAQKFNLEAYEEVVEACKEALKKMNEYGMLQPDNFLTRALKKATEGH
jgi:hypothetical protein